ncbi:hypothetical protein [Georgenia sp. AZ-5]|uniref:hypothetical protein n=1 Tax=Georgenia sp. AZ-5 TaxID=3367526 RepID=UPI0037544C3D
MTPSCRSCAPPARSGEVADPARASTLVRQLSPRGYTTFKGRLDAAALGLRERSVTRMSATPEGDYREWEKVRVWARGIAAELGQHSRAGLSPVG